MSSSGFPLTASSDLCVRMSLKLPTRKEELWPFVWGLHLDISFFYCKVNWEGTNRKPRNRKVCKTTNSPIIAKGYGVYYVLFLLCVLNKIKKFLIQVNFFLSLWPSREGFRIKSHFPLHMFKWQKKNVLIKQRKSTDDK